MVRIVKDIKRLKHITKSLLSAHKCPSIEIDIDAESEDYDNPPQ